MLVTEGVSPGETLNTPDNYTRLTDRGGGKASVYCILVLCRATSSRAAISTVLLFGLVWLRTKSSNHRSPVHDSTVVWTSLHEVATQLPIWATQLRCVELTTVQLSASTILVGSSLSSKHPEIEYQMTPTFRDRSIVNGLWDEDDKSYYGNRASFVSEYLNTWCETRAYSCFSKNTGEQGPRTVDHHSYPT